MSTARMDPLATLPVFLKLRGKVVVMAGADEPAVWKAELLVAAGATLRVFSDAPCTAMRALVESRTSDALTLVDRPWTSADLRDAAMAIGAIEDDAEAARFHDAARAAGVPVNVVDKPAFCDFQFGTIVARSPLVIGISTDGAAPVFGQALRARIEAVLPDGLQLWAQAAKDWRAAVQDRKLDFRARRRFWEAFSKTALDSVDRPPTSEDRVACFAAIDGPGTYDSGRLTLVGTGFGTIESLTLQAAGALQSADVIVFDPDVSRGAVGMSRREAVKRPATELSDARRDIGTWLDVGRQVAWLGTGDPDTCQRWRLRRELAARTSVVNGLCRCPICPTHCLHPAA